jgi:Domain of unknown function (DUF4394)
LEPAALNKQAGKETKEMKKVFALAGTIGICLASLTVAAPVANARDSERNQRDSVYALTANNQLVVFKESSPEKVRARVNVSGLAAGESLVGIDFRPATGRLYGISNLGQLYVIDESSGLTAKVGTPITPALEGTEFGFDFNPTVDRIRVVSDAGQNLRLNPDTGAVAAVDGRLAFAAGDKQAGKQPAVTGAAYTNPDIDPNTATTLFDIDTAADVLVTQNPPNDGVLNTVGALGVDVTKVVGFDIGLPRGESKNASGTALAALQAAGGASTLYRIDLSNGRAEPRGKISEPVRGIAIGNDAARYEDMYALSTTGELLGLSRRSPDRVASRVAVTGLNPNERLLGIDFRPATGRLYGVGSSSQLYVIDHNTGAAAKVGPVFSTPVNGAEFGVDFNPTVDRLRVNSDAGQNLRVNPDTGAIAGVDGALKYAANDQNTGKTPAVAGAAYTNPDIDPNTATTLYDIDTALDTLVIQNPPNDGVLNTVGSLSAGSSGNVKADFDFGPLISLLRKGGFDVESVLSFLKKPAGTLDVGSVLGFDIGQGSKSGLAAFQLKGESSSRLFEIDLASGRASDQGGIAGGATIRGLAIALDSDQRGDDDPD